MRAHQEHMKYRQRLVLVPWCKLANVSAESAGSHNARKRQRHAKREVPTALELHEAEWECRQDFRLVHMHWNSEPMFISE